jgi:hypothetical protein
VDGEQPVGCDGAEPHQGPGDAAAGTPRRLTRPLQASGLADLLPHGAVYWHDHLLPRHHQPPRLGDAKPLQVHQEEEVMNRARAERTEQHPAAFSGLLNKLIVSFLSFQVNYCRTTMRKHQVRVEAVDDGHSWRKYGQKPILGSNYPRLALATLHATKYLPSLAFKGR